MHGKGRIQENAPPHRVGTLCVCCLEGGVRGWSSGFFLWSDNVGDFKLS